MKYINDIIKDQKFKYISFFWIVVSIQFVIGSNLQYRNYSIRNIKDGMVAFFEIFFLSLIFIILHYLILKLIHILKQKKEVNKKIIKNNRVIYFLIIILCWIPILLAFYPAICNYDGAYQIKDYILRKINTANPVLHTFLIVTFYSIGFSLNNCNLGLLFYAVFQMGIMAFIFAEAVVFVEERTEGKVLRNISLIFFAVFPFNQLFPIMTTKDTLFAGFTLMFIMNTYKILEGKTKTTDYIIAIIMTILMISFRINAIYAVVAIIPFIIVVLFKNKERLKSIIGTIIIAIIISNIISNIFSRIIKAEKDEGRLPKLCIFSQAIGKLCKEKQNELTEEEKEKISFYFTSSEEMARIYVPYIADNTAKSINLDSIDEKPEEFKKLIFQLFREYPSVFINAYLNNIRGYWYICDNSFNKVHNSIYPDEFGCLELVFNDIFKNEYNIYSDSKIPQLRQFYKNAFCRNNYTKIPILYVVFQPGIYLYILLAFLLYSIYKKQSKCFIIMMYLFLYFGTCLLGPVALIRYIYNVIVCIPVLFAMIKNEK